MSSGHVVHSPYLFNDGRASTHSRRIGTGARRGLLSLMIFLTGLTTPLYRSSGPVVISAIIQLITYRTISNRHCALNTDLNLSLTAPRWMLLPGNRNSE
ncbi:hypothetical protein CDAR_271231 [Caerostris darwini]|uniref:Uncharacterized protein n=1 Tax=Caerostris darwini TaxID=1538125 RepID=A0AAV4TAH1_9ARAC|nr:hypothetical protein CDAR_271231 [Caerostris darwini]